MAHDPDEEALSWGTERDATHVESKVAAAPVVDTAEELKQTSSFLLVVYGIFGGAFILFIVGWIIFVGGLAIPVVDVLPTIMYRLGEVLAIVSPAIWFGGVLVLTRAGHTRARIIWLVVGLLVVAPWPFILGGIK